MEQHDYYFQVEDLMVMLEEINGCVNVSDLQVKQTNGTHEDLTNILITFNLINHSNID